MPRPRFHDPEVVLDAAEALAAGGGPGAVTVRAVAAATGASNGALYHTFGSRAGLLGRTWLRAAHRFLAVQTELVDASEKDSGVEHSGIAAVVAAAEAPSVFAERYPGSSRLLLTLSRDRLLGEDLPGDLATDVAAAERALVALLVRLARRLWGRGDRRAVDVLTLCVVDLPTAILLDRDRLADPDARARLRAAVRAVLAEGPPPRTP
ncbi:TetR family transcriptional regulator [Nocardia puris]|uniref:TetR family transcriptional regulator n=1 Tax=Nocardia puris TaxID=208602 RepID=A0A366DXX4_9NOCA|nr:TetR family transcriptional regulator [Nocardia puris]MBF6210117.1 TetR family transcriptional regulator [Nocardia puris]MBF6368308.1 TetR family transcriptional regulator [Nocardia puris]MBF6457974.1 TetR family transcriptional regulator [Nocardia puris]RBO94134.1 TetR family transcriptional regulator [Nocardia puris]